MGIALGVLFLGRCLINDGGYHRFEISNEALGKNCIIFMIFGLIGLALGMIFTNFVARKSLGVFLITMYVIGIISIFLSEFKCIHPYGTGHH